MKEPKRVVFADWLRVIACFMVMLVHASENFYGADASGLASSYSMLANESNRFWVAFYDGFVSRTCVPLFMIVSAFLLVPMKPGVTMLQFYRKRFTRILPPMFFFLLLYSLLPMAWGAMTLEQSLADLKLLPFNFTSMAGHLWFMYPLISLYLIIPVISPWLEKASAREERIFLYVFAFSTFIPWLHRFVSPELWGECFWNEFTMIWYCSGFVGYLVLAHYIRFHLDWNRKKRALIGIVCFLAGAAFTGWSFWHAGIPGQLIETPDLEWSWGFCTPNVLTATFGAFLLFTCIQGEKAPKVVVKVSKLSFGMYLMHMFFLAPIAAFIVNGNQAEPLIPVWAAIPLIAILTYLCSAATTFLLSKLPGSKWIIG
ncbi:MAG: acyltransferase [Bacteroidales bacterium]|nr:acyltransferase [Bacteroidales bacterium]